MKTPFMFFAILLLSFDVYSQTIAAGADQSLAICKDGTVKGWGRNVYGMLGNNDTVSTFIPVPASGLSGIVAIASGYAHTLAVRSDGAVWAWGRNNYGELGDNTTVMKTAPVRVLNITNVVAIAGGCFHSLALKEDGTVWSWGRNVEGQLGNGTLTDRYIPGMIPGLSDVVAIACGWLHSMALKADGTVWAWGNNSYGQLGLGSVTTDKTLPVQVMGLTNVISIAAGRDHSMALMADGTVWTWGSNSDGQLGDGTTVQRNAPIQVTALSGVTAIAAGMWHSLAVNPDRSVSAWGYSLFGQLGDGTKPYNKNLPVKAIGLSAVVSVAAGAEYSMALLVDGSVSCWGSNAYGQLAFMGPDQLTPVTAGGLCQVSTNTVKKLRNHIKGYCFLDSNQNGLKDSNEPGINGIHVESICNSYSFNTFSNTAGFFHAYTDTGTVITSLKNLKYYTYTPLQKVSNFIGYNNSDSVYFALTPTADIQDLRITLIPLTPARSGRPASYNIIYENVGTRVMSGSLFMNMNSGLTFVSALPNYDALNGNRMMWNYTNLVPNEKRFINLVLSVPASATIGSVLLPNAYIEPIATDSVPTDNSSAIEQLVVGSLDPNDKTMLQGDDITTQQVASGEYMNYLVRFQNTGNDTAFKVVVRDTLDYMLDWNSLEMISASHQYEVAIRDQNAIEWTFDNILLPDSNVDEAGSHGYLCYRIKPLKNLAAGSEIKNTADIYFDFNTPVRTNTAVTAVVSPTGISKINSLGMGIYPNPSHGEFTIALGVATPHASIKIFNTLGEMVCQRNVEMRDGLMKADFNFLKQGIYFVQAQDGETIFSGKVVVQ